MKIAHIVCTYPPYFGGMGNSAFHMAEGLAARDHDVQIFTPLYTETPDVESLATVARVAPSFSYGNAAILPNIPKLLRGFDLVHLHYPFFGVAGRVARFKKKYPHIPLVTSYHMDPRGSGMIGWYMKWYARHMLPRVLDRSDAVIASTLDFAAASEAALHYQSAPDKWHALPFGVDVERFVPDAHSHELRAICDAVDVPLILFVGGMDTAHHFKGVSVLLRAFATALEHRDMRLVLVGDGDERPMFEALAFGLGISERVHFAGAVSDDALPMYYATADCTVLPSTSTAEAFGMVLLESMSSGTPVIASDLPGVREVAAIGGSTVPAKQVDALASALSQYIPPSADERQALHSRICAEYTWTRVIDRLESVYERVRKEK